MLKSFWPSSNIPAVYRRFYLLIIVADEVEEINITN